jgi:pimeloyl-ACP methyl ester carboxylesterase
MGAEVADLHALLARTKISAPVVLVGHSLGGILARLYFHQYPDSVAGVLLVDPTDEDDVVFNTKVNRWVTVRELDGALGDGARNAAKHRQTDPAPLGDRPLICDRSRKASSTARHNRGTVGPHAERARPSSRGAEYVVQKLEIYP